jgi:hypothetical protein
MPKYFTYEGKQVGYVRKMVDDVILIEDAWTNELRQYLAKNGYDSLLEIVARVLSAGGHPPVTRAQAWIILKELLKDEIPGVLRSTGDEVATKGNLFAKVAKGAASTVDTITAPVGKVVGGSIAAVSNVGKKSTEDLQQGDESAE